MSASSAAAASRRSFEWTVARAKLSDDAKPIAESAASLDALLQLLVDGGLAADGVRLIAAALPAREGIWWGWTAATHATNLTGAKAAKPAAREALGLIEQWIASPGDELRRAVWAAAERAELSTPAGMLGVAIFLAAGSIAPPDLPPLPALPGVHVEILAGAVLVSGLADPAHFQAMTAAFVAQGHAIVNQLGGWDASIARAHAEHERMAELHAQALGKPKPQ